MDLRAAQFKSLEEASFAIYALIYKADELKLFSYPQIQSLFNTAVCKNDLDDGSTLVMVYYIDKNGMPPAYFAQNDASEKMKAEQCNQSVHQLY